MPNPAIPPQSRTLLTVRQFVANQPALTEGSVRWDLFHSATNGLETAGAIIRRGRRILIDPERYLDWLYAGGYQSRADDRQRVA